MLDEPDTDELDTMNTKAKTLRQANRHQSPEAVDKAIASMNTPIKPAARRRAVTPAHWDISPTSKAPDGPNLAAQEHNRERFANWPTRLPGTPPPPVQFGTIEEENAKYRKLASKQPEGE
jgi:hypothetical protein